MRSYRRRHFTRTRAGRHDLYRLRQVPTHLSEYYDFVAAGIVSALLSDGSKTKMTTYLGFSKHMSNLPRGGSRVLIQHEQSIVVGEPDWAIEKRLDFHWSSRGSKWVRIHGSLNNFSDADWIVEYSSANIANVLDSDLAHLYREKVLYIAPLLGNPRQNRPPRDFVTVNTMFGSPDTGRRAAFLERAGELGIEVTNRRGYQTIIEALQSTAILVNVRQKEYFQTFEELRVLPALLHGVLVVTEDSPYLESVPYSKFITSTHPSKIMKAIRKVTSQYEGYHNECFQHAEFAEVMGMLAGSNLCEFRKIAQTRD